MESLSSVILRPGEAERVLAGHPWIYHGSVLRLTQPAADGALVQVKDHRLRFLGVGFYNSRSKINVRVISPERVEVDESFFEQRIRDALALRRRRLPGAGSYRVVNAESDLLSGLTVDKYEDVLVLQASALAMDARKPMIVAALNKIFSPRAIVERSEMSARKFEGLPEASGLLSGSLTPTDNPAWPVSSSSSSSSPSLSVSTSSASAAATSETQQPETPVANPPPPPPAAGTPGALIWVNLNGLRFEVDVLGGHKTGLYLDQQVNYRLVADLVQGGQVLDCFCFLGGFALHAARAGAGHVHGIDQSAEAIAAAGHHAAANGLSGQCSFEAANVFDWLKARTTVRAHERLIPQFDLIILDPPSFTRNRAAIPDALRGYKEIHLRALKLLKPGGTLATFCCSHHVNATMFEKVILEAAFDAHRLLRRAATFTQAPDHPILPAIPETEYLKGYAFEIIR
jgi:23S rRNA (cytosine1962-C5)-methyltransferase